MNFIQTEGSIHLVLQGKPVGLHKTDKHYNVVLQAIKDKKTDQEVLDILEAEKHRMEAAIEVVPGVELKGGQLYHNGECIAGMLGSRMLQMLDEGFDLTPMAALLENLQQNPSYRVVQHLYPFLEKGKIPITEDGCFLAYKAINPDWTSIHASPDGTHLDNSIGRIVSMPRNKVDENPDRTCSYGLHVCSFDYLPHFAHNNGHVVVVKVNPANVVAIPVDYDHTKMRVCEYEVIGEYAGYYANPENVLSNTTVNSGVVLTGTFKVEVIDFVGASYRAHFAYDRLSDAASCMDELLGENDFLSVRIVNTDTGTIVDERKNTNFDDSSVDHDNDDTYSVYHVDASGRPQLVDEGFESVADAASSALEGDSPGRYEVRDQEGNVLKTIS
jgi:hypothetical protein